MVFDLKEFDIGMKAKRTDWGYDTTVFITLETMPLGDHREFYISNTLKSTENDMLGYGMTHADLISDCWEYS